MIMMNANRVLENARKLIIDTELMENTEKELKRKPKLVIITATNDKASLRCVKNKKALAKEFNIEVDNISFKSSVTFEELEKEIDKLNEDSTVDGVILQLPIYNKFSKEEEFQLLCTIDPSKDVEGLGVISKGCLEEDNMLFMPCTPLGVSLILDSYGYEDVEGKNVVVIGRGKSSGSPMATMFRNLDANVTILHSKTSKEDLEFYVRHADIVISCIGKRNLLKEEWFKENSIILGIEFEYDSNGKKYLDFEVDKVIALGKAKAVSDRDNCTDKASIISLILNTFKSYIKN